MTPPDPTPEQVIAEALYDIAARPGTVSPTGVAMCVLAALRAAGYGITRPEPNTGLKDALAETDVPAPDDARSVPDPVLCAACGGTGHRNGNRRAADPFGTCPGCDGTGKASRRIIVYDARAGRCGLTVPVGCTVGDAAWLAVAAMGVRVGPDDCPSLAVNGSGLHPANPLPDDLDFELVVIGGTV